MTGKSPLISLAFLLAAGALARAQSLLPPETIRLDSFVGWRPPPHGWQGGDDPAAPPPNWQVAGGIAGDPRREHGFQAVPGTGLLVSLPQKGMRNGNILTTWEHGDAEVDIDFMMPLGSNSGVFLEGRYEVQLYDSWGVKQMRYLDCGAIYERWDESRGAGHEGYEPHPPLVNACRAPGLWQHLHVEFEAPRFDADGHKTKNALFRRVLLNGFLVQKDVEVTGPTRTRIFSDERPTGPLMIQGDHGPVAIRNLAIKRFSGDRIEVSDLHYKLYTGDYSTIGAYDAATPTAEGVPAKFGQSAIRKGSRFGLVFTGSLAVPREGAYAFSVFSDSMTRMTIDDREVIAPLEVGGQAGTIALTAGHHRFRTDLVQTSSFPPPRMGIVAEGPGIVPRLITEDGGMRPGRSLPMEAADRVIVQRSFVPFEPRKRLYGINVGSPAGVHFAYNFETGALLRVWRGGFLDMFGMWDARGGSQLATPTGPSLTFGDLPVLVMIERQEGDAWPEVPTPLWSSQGYSLDGEGYPTFMGRLSDVSIEDRFAPTPDGKALMRTFKASGKLAKWSTWVLLADADRITPQPGGAGWIIGDRAWYVDWPSDAALRPVVRVANGRAQLAMPVTSMTLGKPVTYTILW